MSQFRPLPSFRSNDVPAVTEESSNNTPFAPSLPSLTTMATTTPTTNQLPVPMLTPGQLALFTSPLPVAANTGRYFRIPGAVKREPVTEELPRSASARRTSSRLRHAVIIFVAFFVVLTALLSLSPLDNGQSSIPLIGGISDWVHSQQLDWQLQAQIVQVAQPKPTAVTQSNPTPPPITLPTSAYVAIARQDAINVGISPDYFTRQIYLESGFNPNAYSPAGAEGIAQFEPGTAAGLGINPWNPIQALQGAARLMASYNSNYGGNYAMALAAYNGGSGTVQYAVNACGSAAWMNCLPPETRHYIYEIMGI